MKQLFLVLYDYETGGVWSYLRADSREQIHAKFPMLEIYDEPPPWMNEARRQEIELKSTYDLETAQDDDPQFFGSLVRRDAS